MPNVHLLRNDRRPFIACPPAHDQERARAALYALRDLLEAVPAPVATCEPAGLGAILGMVADSLPVLDED